MSGAGAGAEDGRPRGLDWPGLMQAGLGRLGLKPWEFWALTPVELALMLGIDLAAAAPGGMNRARLDELLARFPDSAPPPAGTGDMGGSNG